MVVVKRLDSEYPRLGYEVQKGLMIDMPNGDGNAEIVENEDGSLVLSENDGKDTVTLKDVHLSDFVDHDVRLALKHGFEDNHVTLENVVIDSPMSTLVSYEGNNTISNTVLSGHNVIKMKGQTIADSFIKDSDLERTSLTNGAIKRSSLIASRVNDSSVVNSTADGAVVTMDSSVELSDLFGDYVTAAVVGGVQSGWDGHSWEFDERHFEDGYFVGNGKNANQHDFNHGYEQVADSDAYADGLASLAVDGNLPYRPEKDNYQLSDMMKERIEKAMARVPEDDKVEAVELAPFLKEFVEPASLTDAEIEQSIAEDTARREADDFVIDESQFDVTSQQGLQQ